MANSYIEKVLYTGQVPKPLSYEIIREDLIQALSHKIRCRTRGNEHNWMIVCGPPGSGKSRLVAQTLRSCPELIGHFYDRVFWMVDNSNDNQLLTLMTDLLCRLNCQALANLPSNEFDTFVIREMIKQELLLKPKTLLVVDGIQTQACFDFCSYLPCHIIFTTCFADLFYESHENSKFFMGKDQELNLNEIQELAANFGFGLSVEETICLKYNSGNNPALLVKLLNAAKANPGVIQMFIKNKAFQPYENFRYNSSYCYRSLSERIEQLLKYVDQSALKCFECCSVLPADKWIRREIIQMIWPVDSCGEEPNVELWLVAELVNKSLMEKRVNDDVLYLLYPLIHSYCLRNALKNESDELIRVATLLKSRIASESEYSSSNIFSEFYEENQDQIESLIQKCSNIAKNTVPNLQDLQEKTISWHQWFKSFFY